MSKDGWIMISIFIVILIMLILHVFFTLVNKKDGKKVLIEEFYFLLQYSGYIFLVGIPTLLWFIPVIFDLDGFMVNLFVCLPIIFLVYFWHYANSEDRPNNLKKHLIVLIHALGTFLLAITFLINNHYFYLSSGWVFKFINVSLLILFILLTLGVNKWKSIA